MVKQKVPSVSGWKARARVQAPGETWDEWATLPGLRWGPRDAAEYKARKFWDEKGLALSGTKIDVEVRIGDKEWSLVVEVDLEPEFYGEFKRSPA